MGATEAKRTHYSWYWTGVAFRGHHHALVGGVVAKVECLAGWYRAGNRQDYQMAGHHMVLDRIHTGSVGGMSMAGNMVLG